MGAGQEPHLAANRTDIGRAAAAEEVGRLLARRGAILVCGGLSGVMEAACRGAKSAGGTTVGILPGKDPAAANPWVDVCICSSLGLARNALVACSGRALIAIAGAVGTLAEIAMGLNFGRTVVTLNSWPIDRSRLTRGERVLEAGTPAEAVDLALAAAGSASPNA